MTPALIPESAINAILSFGCIVAIATFTLGVVNLSIAVRRLRLISARLEADERTRIVARELVRDGLGHLFVSTSAFVFSGQGLVGDFALVNNWFSYVFLVAVYAGVTTRLVLGLFAMRDRRRLDALVLNGNGKPAPKAKKPRA